MAVSVFRLFTLMEGPYHPPCCSYVSEAVLTSEPDRRPPGRPESDYLCAGSGTGSVQLHHDPGLGGAVVRHIRATILWQGARTVER